VIGVGTTGPRGTDSRGDRTPARASAPSAPGRGWTGIELAAIDPVEDRPYWLALSLVPGVGPVGFARLLRRYGTARAAWAAGVDLLAELPRVPEEAASSLRRLQRRRAPAVADELERATRRAGGAVLTALDAGYPAALSGLDPRPAVLYLAGDGAALEATCVAVVGTRRATGYGHACAAEIGDALGRAGVTVISGLALGIDGDVHRAAVAAGGRGVAVLPSPLDRVYPPAHRKLAAELVATGGALVSELPPGAPAGRPDFARRNRIIAGLARAVVVVEAPDHSGALLTAAAATDYGRDLFAVPGPIDAAASRGCNRLIADHLASLMTSPASLLHRIGSVADGRAVSVATLSEAEGLVLGTLLRRSASIEELMSGTGLATGPLASTLTLLEARGLVDSYGGATFHPTLTARRIGAAEPRSS